MLSTLFAQGVNFFAALPKLLMDRKGMQSVRKDREEFKLQIAWLIIHGSGDGEDKDFRGTGQSQRLSARSNRGARGEHIINQQHSFVRN
jgi:hypothetical protein